MKGCMNVMKIKTPTIIILIAAVISFFSQYDIAYCQPDNVVTPDSTERQDTEETAVLPTLKGTIEIIEELEDEIRSKKTELKQAATQDLKIEIKEEINKLYERLDPLKLNFEEIATGINLESFEEQPQKHFDWKDELQTLLGPLIKELKNITEEPREIERLRSEVSHYEKKLALTKSAKQNIHKLINQTQEDKLENQLTELEKIWLNREQNISNQLLISQYQLSDKLKDRKSILESGQNIVRIFFKSRGKNFIFAALAFIFVFFILRIIHRYVYKASPVLRSVKRPYYIRILDIMYHVLTVVGATAAMLVVLYTSGDWVLLGLAFILIVGVAWTAKNTLPRFWEQSKLLLNLGSVRENERVIYNGIPWRVVSLNIYTYLVNPELKGGVIRFPLKELAEFKSRPFHHDEPWFPCRENEFVILADGTFGKVALQTPEIVQLELPAGCLKTYATEEFVKQNPKNISKGFRINVTFGIDYKYQEVCTTEIPSILQKTLYEGLINGGYEDTITHFKVEFKEAGDSSLDYEIMADFSGKVAKDYFLLIRTLQRLCIDTCNKYGWEIPFNQITVHTVSVPQ